MMNKFVAPCFRGFGYILLFSLAIAVSILAVRNSANVGRESVESGSVVLPSFSDPLEVGEIEGRKLYRFDLDDGTRCLAISGYNGSSLDCDWMPAPAESVGR